MLIELTAPSWTDGELLSAYKLNQVSDAANDIRGAALAPTGIFVKRGVDSFWYLRRRYRYLHVAYSVTLHGEESLDVSIDFGTASNNYTHGSDVSYQWRTYDLNAVGDTVAGEFYAIAIDRDGNDFDFQVEAIIESTYATPNDITAGTYVTPPTWSAAEVVGATKLNQLSSTITSMASAVRSPSAATLRAEDTATWRLVRRDTNLVINLTVGGSSPDVDIYVAGEKVVNNATTGTHTIDLSAVSGGPAVGEGYDLALIRTSGSVTINSIQETPTAPGSYAPVWAHGDQVSDADGLNTYATLLGEAYAILGDVGWQFAALYRPYEDPLWTAHKTARYLHYMRNGALPAAIVDPSGVDDDIGLKRTTSSDLFNAYDLDSIDWLAPGGLFYVEQADVVWMDDEP